MLFLWKINNKTRYEYRCSSILKNVHKIHSSFSNVTQSCVISVQNYHKTPCYFYSIQYVVILINIETREAISIFTVVKKYHIHTVTYFCISEYCVSHACVLSQYKTRYIESIDYVRNRP